MANLQLHMTTAKRHLEHSSTISSHRHPFRGLRIGFTIPFQVVQVCDLIRTGNLQQFTSARFTRFTGTTTAVLLFGAKRAKDCLTGVYFLRSARPTRVCILQPSTANQIGLALHNTRAQHTLPAHVMLSASRWSQSPIGVSAADLVWQVAELPLL